MLSLVATTELIILPLLPVSLPDSLLLQPPQFLPPLGRLSSPGHQWLPKLSSLRISVVFAFVSAPGAALSSAAPVSATHWGAAPGEAEATSVAETPGHRKETLGKEARWGALEKLPVE